MNSYFVGIHYMTKGADIKCIALRANSLKIAENSRLYSCEHAQSQGHLGSNKKVNKNVSCPLASTYVFVKIKLVVVVTCA